MEHFQSSSEIMILCFILISLFYQIIGANPAWEGNGFRVSGNACYVLCTQSCIDFAKVQEDAKVAFELKKSSEEIEGVDGGDDNENDDDDDEVQIL